MNEQDGGMALTGPAIVLVRPQLGMNIGMVARGMANFALDDLRLVQPRDGWPNPDAGPPAAGADDVLAQTTVAESVDAALFDCALTFATTVRPRHMQKPVLTPREAIARMKEGAAKGLRSGILFGPERSGLQSDDLAAVDAIVTCPVNPAFSSLNLAQAVLLLAYEWFQAGLPGIAPAGNGAPAPHAEEAPAPALHGELASLVRHLEDELAAAGYFHVAEREPATKRAIAQLLARPGFTTDEVRMLHGIVRALAEKRRRQPMTPP